MSLTHLVFAMLLLTKEKDPKTRYRRKSWPLDGIAEAYIKSNGERTRKLQDEPSIFPGEYCSDKVFYILRATSLFFPKN